MIILENIFFFFILQTLFNFIFFNNNFIVILIYSEFLILNVYLLLSFAGIFFNIAWVFGFALSYLIFMGLELCLAFLLLAL